jgi:hypothetical protein
VQGKAVFLGKSMVDAQHQGEDEITIISQCALIGLDANQSGASGQQPVRGASSDPTRPLTQLTDLYSVLSSFPEEK